MIISSEAALDKTKSSSSSQHIAQKKQVRFHPSTSSDPLRKEEEIMIQDEIELFEQSAAVTTTVTRLNEEVPPLSTVCKSSSSSSTVVFHLPSLESLAQDIKNSPPSEVTQLVLPSPLVGNVKYPVITIPLLVGIICLPVVGTVIGLIAFLKFKKTFESVRIWIIVSIVINLMICLLTAIIIIQVIIILNLSK